MSDHAETRLRPHPEERFAPQQVGVDLTSTIARLRSEPGAGEKGRRQQTLYKQGGLTIALFLFERFTDLPEHVAAGVVSIHVLGGRVKVTAEQQVHDLGPGQMVILSPGVRHALAATEPSEVLVTVRLTE